jgi:hypothetical protein
MGVGSAAVVVAAFSILLRTAEAPESDPDPIDFKLSLSAGILLTVAARGLSGSLGNENSSYFSILGAGVSDLIAFLISIFAVCSHATIIKDLSSTWR